MVLKDNLKDKVFLTEIRNRMKVLVEDKVVQQILFQMLRNLHQVLPVEIKREDQESVQL